MQWNYICDRCGFKRLNNDSRLEWTGLRVCPQCYEARNPQDFVRGKADRQNPPWVRPEPTDVFDETSLLLQENGALILNEAWDVNSLSPDGIALESDPS